MSDQKRIQIEEIPVVKIDMDWNIYLYVVLGYFALWFWIGRSLDQEKSQTYIQCMNAGIEQSVCIDLSDIDSDRLDGVRED